MPATRRLILSTLIFVAAAPMAIAGSINAPEIDASAGVAALTLLAGSILVLRSRRRN